MRVGLVRPSGRIRPHLNHKASKPNGEGVGFFMLRSKEKKYPSEALAERIRVIREIKEMLEQKEFELVLNYQSSKEREQ